MQTGLAGKVVIVTAATANTGRGIALAFAAEGARELPRRDAGLPADAYADRAMNSLIRPLSGGKR